ncbi:MAG TPA: alcohol dehydrogenase catalytic domain-containing protein, partial [Burkholderiales bacterium]|nr:alcohol dehydrogenase catalytic domain-containing protein [Burkholderiales bacterium]
MPKIGPNDALVRVRACGVGLTVVSMIATPGRITSFPRIPGHEIAGDVVEVGSEVRTVKAGTRVTNHFYLTCGNCRYCRSGRETLCENFRGNVGSGCDGGYAEYVALPERNLVPIPDGVTDLEAAVASDAIATPYHACHVEAQISPGDDVLVTGAGGGVGIHMVQMARLCGGRVIAAEVSEEKLELAKTMGADELIDARRGGIVKQV